MKELVVIQCPFCEFNTHVFRAESVLANGTELALDHISVSHPERSAYSPRPGVIVEDHSVDFSDSSRASNKVEVKKNISVSLSISTNNNDEADTAFKKMAILASRLGFEDGLNFSLSVNTWSDEEEKAE